MCSPALPAKEVAIAYLSNCGFDMFEEEGDRLIAYAKDVAFNEEEYRFVLEQLRELAAISVEENWVESENWNAQWESNYDPIDVDGKIMMRAPFHAPPVSGLDIIIQPEMSFGTGHHPTTWQMMHALHALQPAGQNVLDMGCGTGALAIAARKLGAARVVAIDNDEWSYRNTLDNIQRNGLDGQIEARLGDANTLSTTDCSFHTILANINRNILLADMRTYVRHLYQGGHLVLSGFFPADIPVLLNEAEGHGLELSKSFDRDGWACLLLVNKAN